MLQKGSKLTPEINAAIKKLWTNGTISQAPEEVVQPGLLEAPDPEVRLAKRARVPPGSRGLLQPARFRLALPDVWAGFQVNLKMMFLAEPLVLVFALAIAIVRGLPGRGAAPLRGLAVVYTDLFRGTPLILVAFLVGFGLPACSCT